MTLLTIDADAMEGVAGHAVAVARALGADHVVASARASAAVQVTARAGETDIALRDARQSLTLRVYRGSRAGVATTAALDPAAVRRAAEEAYALAALMGEDDDGLPPPIELMAVGGAAPPIHAPVEPDGDGDPAKLRATALAGDAAIRAVAAPAGAAVETMTMGASASEGLFALATSAGFCRSQLYSNHSRWAAALVRDGDGAVNDYADSHDRQAWALEPVATLAERAVGRAAQALGARAVPSHRGPVLFEARAAAALVGDLVGALSGNPQHQRRSFLPDALGTTVAAEHLDLEEDPFEPFGLASGGFDGEGIAGCRRAILSAGVVQGYFLGTRSARRLGMLPTGNADGPWNLTLRSRAPGGDFAAQCRAMGRGLVISRMMGGQSDPVTGNWTYAVSGLWVEGGVPVHAVTDVTVSGNLRAMLKAVVSVGDDVARVGAIRTGSVLIDGLQIGGAA